MKMTFRWYGEGNDSVTLDHIRQIPGTDGLVWALHDIPAGDEWPKERIQAFKRHAEGKGFHIDVVESVNVHEDIKLGGANRVRYIENYKNTLRSLGEAGVKVVCYNFMPIFDWTRSDLYKELPDGSTALFYEKAKVDGIDPEAFLDMISSQDGMTMPGWEPERLSNLKSMFDAYKGFTNEDLWGNLKYFLSEITPVCEECGIKMAIHPDDPPWSIFGLPRIITGRDGLKRMLDMVPSPANGITLCSGSLGASPDNDIPAIIRELRDRIYFAHVRNLKRFPNGDFYESSHKTSDGSLDIAEIIRAYHDIGYKYYIRPDHGRHLWGEKCRPGYGLYDRALGIMYLWGLWDAYEKMGK